MANEKRISSPRWSEVAIKSAAGRLIAQYELLVGRDHILKNGLHFDDVYEKLIYSRFGVELYEDDDLGSDTDGQKVLGRYDVRANTAYLDQVVSRESGDPRRAFTCWHEVAGHGVLQGAWLRKRLDTSGIVAIDVTEKSMSADTERSIERQANVFASHVAAPDWLINYAVNTTFRPNRRFIFKEPCIYCLDVHGLPLKKYIVDAGDLCGWIGSKISGFFGGLSAEALGYRLSELGWVRDLSTPDLHLHRSLKSKSALSGRFSKQLTCEWLMRATA